MAAISTLKPPLPIAPSAQVAAGARPTAAAANPAGAAGATADTFSRSVRPPMHLAFDVFLEQVKTPQQRAQLLATLAGQMRKGDTIWLAVEGSTVAKNPAILDQLAAEKQQWEKVLGPEGVQVKTRIRCERIHTDRQSSAQAGMQDLSADVLMARKVAGKPVADAISYDYESGYGFTGGEYTPHDTANAARLFAEGQGIAKSLGADYFVEPSVTAYHPHPGALYTKGKFDVTLDWQKLGAFTDGFNFQTQRINAGTGMMPVDARTRAADRQDYAGTVGHLVEGLAKGTSKKPWVMTQLSTEWSEPQTVVAAAAAARDQAPDIKSYYIWWYDPGRSESQNVQRLVAMTGLWNKTFDRGPATTAPQGAAKPAGDDKPAWWNPLAWIL